MSALLRISESMGDIGRDLRWVKGRHSTMSASCLLHPDKRTLIIGFCTFALGQEETLMLQQ
jgi:hypothetical protein